MYIVARMLEVFNGLLFSYTFLLGTPSLLTCPPVTHNNNVIIHILCILPCSYDCKRKYTQVYIHVTINIYIVYVIYTHTPMHSHNRDFKNYF